MMSSTYTIPADVELPSEVGAVVHLAVPGEPCRGSQLCRAVGPCVFCGATFEPDQCVLLEGYWYLPPHRTPPSVLADLVGKQCETCDGDGYIDFDTDGYQGPCSACAGSGSALVDLVRECGHARIHPDEPDCDCQCASCVSVTDCNEFGTVSLGRWKVKALDPTIGGYVATLELVVAP